MKIVDMQWSKIRNLIGDNMFKKIKNYLSLQRRIQIEILETLCTICLYLDYEGHYSRNCYSEFMRGHFKSLKDLSEEIRYENRKKEICCNEKKSY